VDSTPFCKVGMVSPPGALISIVDPKLLEEALSPLRSVAATVITPLQLAGWMVVVFRLALLLPAATTTIAPTALTASIAI